MFTFFNFQAKTLIFAKSFATKNSWFSAFCLHLSAVYLFIYQLFVYLFQLFVYYFEFSSKTLKNHDFFAKMATLNSCFIYFFVYMFSCLFTIFSCLFTFFFTWQCKQKCKQTAENHEFKLDILAKKSWNFNVFASNSKSKQTADCLHF